MKKYLYILSLGLAIAALVLATQPARAELVQTLGFQACSNNNQDDVDIGEAQLLVQIWPVGGDATTATQVGFAFHNIGPEDSSITDIYFADGELIENPQLIDADDGTGGDPGVDFSPGASPGSPPSGNNCNPPWGENTTQFLETDSDSPVQPNGINPDEWLGVLFDLKDGKTYTDVIDQLSSGDLRIAIHVQGYASGGSETFHNGPPTAITLASFEGASRQGQVTLSWTTGTEINNIGFNIYRSALPSGSRQRMNPILLAASGDAVSGARYSFVDSPGYGVYYYWLEDVDASGTTTLHGPVRVNVRPAFSPPRYRPVIPRQ